MQYAYVAGSFREVSSKFPSKNIRETSSIQQKIPQTEHIRKISRFSQVFSQFFPFGSLRSARLSGYGKPWTFTVGLVGKPSAGAEIWSFQWEDPREMAAKIRSNWFLSMSKWTMDVNFEGISTYFKWVFDDQGVLAGYISVV